MLIGVPRKPLSLRVLAHPSRLLTMWEQQGGKMLSVTRKCRPNITPTIVTITTTMTHSTIQRVTVCCRILGSLTPTEVREEGEGESTGGQRSGKSGT